MDIVTRYRINPQSGVPIYRQVKRQIERAIASTLLAPGDKLPTVKELSISLSVNPNTVARAYRELSLDGVIETLVGRGSFVPLTLDSDTDRGQSTDFIVADFAEIARDVKTVGFSRNTVEQCFDRALTQTYQG
jgi:GntR family transcriptional regulator